MGKFANRDPGVGAYVGPKTKTPGTSGFAAIGKPVPYYRRQAGYDHCKQMGLTTEASFSAVGAMARKLEKDEPHDAMELGLKYLNATGVYRLMAVLLTAERVAT